MRARWVFFTYFCALAMPGRFIPIFYAAHAQTASQIGLLIGTKRLVSLGAGPFFCNLADRTGRRILVAALSYLAFTFCFIAQCIAHPDLALIPASARFPLLLCLHTFSGIFEAPVMPLVKAAAISQLRDMHGDQGHERYGIERLWGTISWGICALGLGFVLDLPGVGIWPVYVGLALFTSVFLATLWAFERGQRATKPPLTGAVDIVDEESSLRAANNSAPGSTSEAYGTLQCDQDASSSAPVHTRRTDTSMSPLKTYVRILTRGGFATLMFFNLVFWLRGGTGVVKNLIFLFFENELHASNVLCGISVVLTVLFEIPFFAYAPGFLERFGSANLLIFGSLAFVFRVFCYTGVPNVWYALLVEPLHGLTYAAVDTAAVSFVAEKTPRELEATGQSLLLIIGAVAGSLGAAVGGYVMQTLGSKALYRGASGLVLLATIAFSITTTCTKPERTGSGEHEDNLDSELQHDRKIEEQSLEGR